MAYICSNSWMDTPQFIFSTVIPDLLPILLTRGKISEAGSFIGVTESERAAFAAVSAFSFPLIPV